MQVLRLNITGLESGPSANSRLKPSSILKYCQNAA